MMYLAQALCLLMVATGVSLARTAPAASVADGPVLAAAQVLLSFPAVGNGQYGVRMHDLRAGGADAFAAEPVQMLVCTSCTDETVNYPFTGVSYSAVTAAQRGLLASATYTSPNGSVFHIDDVYSVARPDAFDGGAFVVMRTVSVVTAAPGDRGFNSEYLLGFQKPVSLQQYHLFAPAIWYDHNANDAQSGGFGTNPRNSYILWRETRSALPLMMMQDPSTGSTLSIAHIHSTPAPGMTNLNAAWQVDPTVQYGSIGVQQTPNVALGFIYPASEGDGSYLTQKSYAANGPGTNWVRRSHPVATNVTHTYTLMLRLERYTLPGGGADFQRAMAHTWRETYDSFNPAIATVPADTVYQDGIDLLNNYVEDVNGATGLPFGRPVTPDVAPATNPVYEMGYVGQQIPLGFQLFRYGVLHGDAGSQANGEAILNFWASKASQPSGLPMAVYDATLQKFGTLGGTCPYPLFTRLLSDGMEGMAAAAIFAREHNVPQPAWEKFSQAYGDWLVAHQNADGSFYRAYSTEGTVYNQTCLKQNPYAASKLNTMDPVRFLVELYFATGSSKYLAAAQSAGAYSLTNIYNPVQYIGGTIDNPNVIDKEGGVEAVHGALALVDAAIAQGDSAAEKTWLTAAQDAADYSRTWAYAWSYPIGLPEGATSSGAYPAYQFAGTRAIGMIATGQSGADISLSYESYDYLRLYLFQQDKSLWDGSRRGDFDLRTAYQFWNNTKLTTQLTGVQDQQFGYAKDGLVGEGVDLSELLYQEATSSRTWLPWLTNAELDPILRMDETFHVTDLSDTQHIGLSTLEEENKHVYPSPGSIGWGSSSP